MTNLSKIVTGFKLIAKEKNPAFREGVEIYMQSKDFQAFKFR